MFRCMTYIKRREQCSISNNFTSMSITLYFGQIQDPTPINYCVCKSKNSMSAF